MIKYLVWVLLFIPFFGITQQNELISTFKISENQLQFKWIPTSPKALVALLNNTTNIKISFNGDEKKVLIKPLSDTINTILEGDTSLFIFSEIFCGNPSNADSLHESFINSLVQNFLDHKVATYMGNVVTLPVLKKTKSIDFSIKNDALTKEYYFTVNIKDYNLGEIPLESKVERSQVNLIYNVLNLNKDYIAYNVYRKEKGEKSFVKINNRPNVPFASKDDNSPHLREFIDKKVKEGSTYEYKVTGIDYFGEEIQESNIIKVYIPFSVNASVRIDTVLVLEQNCTVKVNISPLYDSITPDVEKVQLLRSDSLKGPYTKIIEEKIKSSIESVELIDDYEKTGVAYFYKVQVLSQDNDTIISNPYYFFTLDQQPPEKVTELKGEIDSSGIVLIKWTAPKDEDIQGYRVFRANTKKEEFQEITPNFVSTTELKDTLLLNSLTNEVFYYVVAVDHNFNNSPKSDTLLILKPDTIAPVSSVFKYYRGNNEGVHLKWYNSTSDDVTFQYLVRTYSQEKINIVDTLLIWNDTTSKYLDNTVEPGVRYNYKIMTIDQRKNASLSPAIKILHETGTRQPIQDFSVSKNEELKQLELSWSYYLDSDVFSYEIYRARGEGRFYSFKSVREKQSNGEYLIIDSDLKINNVYKYKIKAILNSGIQTSMSEEKIIEY